MWGTMEEETKKEINEQNIEDNDEELNIDFSKITKLFKRKNKLDKIKDLKEETKEIKEDLKEQIEDLKEKQEEVEEISQDLDDDEQKAKEADKLDEDIKEKVEEVKEIKKEILEEDKDEEVSIDFSKIKSFFKGKKEKIETQNDEEININFKESINSTLTFIKKHQLVFLILIPILLSIFFRAYPISLPVTDEWAENSVYNNIKAGIESQVNQQYPNLPDTNKQLIIDSQFEKILEEEGSQIDSQIAGTSNYFKSKMQDESGQTYLLAIDPYLWYGEARNYLNNGHFGDEFVDGQSWYSLRNGRPGKLVESFDSPGSSIINQLFAVYLYKALRPFNKDLSLMGALFLVPLIIVTLSIIPAFFIGNKMGGPVGGLFAGIIVAINAALLGRTPAGFADTDPYNVFFPLFIAWAFIGAIETKETKNRIIFSSIGGLLVGLYSRAWSGWWYPMLFVLGALGIGILYYIGINFKEFKKNPLQGLIKISDIKNNLIILGCFLGTSAFFVTIFNNVAIFIEGFLQPLQFIRLKDVAVTTLWPNVMTTVAEFNVVPLNSIMSQMGGKLLFFIAIIGILLTIIIKNKEGKRDIMYATFLTLWLIGTTYAFTKGTRFSILMVPAFAIAFGIALGITHKYSIEWLSKNIHINKYLASVLVILIFVLLLVNPLKAAHNTAKNEIPSMTDAWYDSLTEIKEDSEDAIVTSWWDFGHWFVAISERKVTFDGADQGKRIHYVGKSLLVDDEESVAILKMLNCGQNEGPFLLEDYLEGDTAKATSIINEIMFYNKNDAIKTLQSEGLSEEQIENLTKLTHCDDLIPQYYITSEDMIGKSGVWGHFGSWDFDKATMHNALKKKSLTEGTKYLQEEYNMSEANADNLYYEIQSTDADRWISPWPGYMGGPYPSNIKGDLVTCSNGITVNLTNYKTLIPTQQGIMSPNSLIYATKTELKEKIYESTLGVSVALIPEDKGYICLLMDPLLAKSTFTRLFFFDGHGSKYFEKFSDKTTFTGQRIITWKVNWEPQKPLIMDELQEKTVVKEGNLVSVNYIGWTEENGVFDSSILNWQELKVTSQTNLEETYDQRELDFEAGAGQMISGFDKGVIGMNINSIKTIQIPPEEAYGLDPNQHPLGNKTLFFKIKVIDIS